MSNLIYLVDLDSTDDEIDRHVNALVKIDIDLKDKLVHYNDGTNLIRKVEELCPSLKVS